MTFKSLQLMRINANPKRLKVMRALLAETLDNAGCGERERRLLVLAVSEACMNVIQHAYRGDTGGEMVLEVLQEDGDLEFRLTDFANTVDPSMIKPRSLDEVRPGGLGIHFIQCIMDDFRFTVPQDGRGNLLIMRKKAKKVREAAENAM